MPSDQVSQRIVAVVDALENDPTLARGKVELAQHVGCTIGQLDHVINRYDQSGEAWRKAREIVAERRCIERRCPQCGRTKPADEFPNDRSDPCGIGRRCLVCNRVAVRLAYQRRKAKAAESAVGD